MIENWDTVPRGSAPHRALVAIPSRFSALTIDACQLYPCSVYCSHCSPPDRFCDGTVESVCGAQYSQKSVWQIAFCRGFGAVASSGIAHAYSVNAGVPVLASRTKPPRPSSTAHFPPVVKNTAICPDVEGRKHQHDRVRRPASPQTVKGHRIASCQRPPRTSRCPLCG